MSIVGKIWENRSKIAEGIKNRIFKKEDVEEVARERMKICAECVHIDHEGSKCLIPGTQPCCGKCGCNLSTKVRSLSSDCGDEEYPRWNAVMTQNEEDELKTDIGYNEEGDGGNGESTTTT